MKVANNGLTIVVGGALGHFPEKFVVSALEKQMPKKTTPHIVQPVEAPIQIGNGRWQKGTTVYKCPNCGEWVSKTYKHCPACGQALDWSECE